MNRQDLHRLRSVRGYPALTITMPAHRTAPDNRQDPIRLRNLVSEATDRLRREFPRREIEGLLTRLDDLVRGVNHSYNLDGLALFAHRDFGQVFHLPFRLHERVVLDETFATRDLVFALNRTHRYWTLVLTEKPTRLLEGAGGTLTELIGGGFPMVHEGPGGAAPLPRGVGIDESAHRDERHRQFFRQVDAALRPFVAEDPLPLALVGVERYLAFFREVSSHAGAVVATVTGSHSDTSLAALSALVWPAVETAMRERRREALAELERAVGSRKSASTLGEVWRFAQEGRGSLLLVEESYHAPANLDPSGRHLAPAEVADGSESLPDAVDEIVETVLEKQGRVVFVEDGGLAKHQRIALILRY